MKGVSVFEIKEVRTGKKRKRKEKGDPEDLDGYMGPWREYVDQVKEHLPTPLTFIYMCISCIGRVPSSSSPVTQVAF